MVVKLVAIKTQVALSDVIAKTEVFMWHKNVYVALFCRLSGVLTVVKKSGKTGELIYNS